MLVFFISWFGFGISAHGQVLTANLEIKRVPNVGASWVTVNLENNYTSPVIVCTYNLPSDNDPAVTTRIQNVSATSFQVRVQQFENSNVVSASNVHCIISDEGAYNSGGLKYEARTVLSDRTSGQFTTDQWTLNGAEEVTSDITQTYTNPIVLGQVMSFNDSNASVFWSFNCLGRRTPPYVESTRACVGKHIGQISGSRNDETIGYIVVESGSATVNDIDFEAALGADTVAGVGDVPPYNYTVSGDFDVGILSQSAMDGSQGGWAVLYGNDPLPSNIIQMGVEEEVVAGDNSRTHTEEQVAYWVFEDNQVPDLSASKTVDVSSESISNYSIPGSDVLYTISFSNTGSGPTDLDSIVVIDALPTEVIFYNGDVDGAGPETGSVIFTSMDSGLSFDPVTDLAFSSAVSKPMDFSSCTYSPTSGYDPNVTYICFNPKGAFRSGSITSSEFTLSFRAQVE